MKESTKAPAGGPPLGTLPVLVYDHGLNHSNNRQTAYTIGDQSLHTSAVPELVDNYYHVTAQGWVLLIAPGPSPCTRLWDPRSGESVALPAMEREPPENWECYLSDAPTAPSCVVLVLDMDRPTFLYCRVGDSRWKAHDYDIGNSRLPLEYAPPTRLVIQHTAAVGGKFYFQETGKLGAIDFSTATPEFSFVDYPQPALPDGSNCGRGYLVESRGELFDVYVCLKGFSPDILTVRVYKVDLSGPTLSEVKDLGDRAFLLSYLNSQLLCSASKYGVKGNCIYFVHDVTEDTDGGLLCIYDLDDQSLKSVRPCPQMVEVLRSPFWMLPTDQSPY